MVAENNELDSIAKVNELFDKAEPVEPKPARKPRTSRKSAVTAAETPVAYEPSAPPVTPANKVAPESEPDVAIAVAAYLEEHPEVVQEAAKKVTENHLQSPQPSAPLSSIFTKDTKSPWLIVALIANTISLLSIIVWAIPGTLFLIVGLVAGIGSLVRKEEPRRWAKINTAYSVIVCGIAAFVVLLLIGLVGFMAIGSFFSNLQLNGVY